MTDKESLIRIIKNKGTCNKIKCACCYYRRSDTDSRCNTIGLCTDEFLKKSIKIYLEQFGSKEDLVELLI